MMMCPDCGVELADVLPVNAQAAVSPDASWVVMGQVESTMKSDMAKGSLDSNNIPSVILSSTFNIAGKGFTGSGSLLQGGGAGNVILVPREFEEDALLILEAVLGDDLIQPEQ